jgi:hypothetical protein
MANTEDAARAIKDLNGFVRLSKWPFPISPDWFEQELHGRKIRVDFSLTERPHDPTPGQCEFCGSPLVRSHFGLQTWAWSTSVDLHLLRATTTGATLDVVTMAAIDTCVRGSLSKAPD